MVVYPCLDFSTKVPVSCRTVISQEAIISVHNIGFIFLSDEDRAVKTVLQHGCQIVSDLKLWVMP